MRRFSSACLEVADRTSVAAGGALAVDRELFSKGVTKLIKENEYIHIKEDIVTDLPTNSICVVATGPLTDGGLADDLAPVPPESIPGEMFDMYTIKILRSNGRWEWYTLTGKQLYNHYAHRSVELTDSQLASLKALLGLS